MTLLTLVVILLIVGILLWGLNQLPMVDANIKKIITVIVIVVLAICTRGGSLLLRMGAHPRGYL